MSKCEAPLTHYVTKQNVYFVITILVFAYITSFQLQCSKITITTHTWLVILNQNIYFVQINMGHMLI